MMNAFITMQDVSKSYQNVSVLRKVSVTFDKGQQYVIMGASGSGKSTMLYLLGGIEEVDQGQIFVDQLCLTGMGDEALAHHRNQRVGFVFQFHFLLSSMNCWDNICLPFSIGRSYRKGGDAQIVVEKRIRDYAKLLKVEHCLKKFPYELSGGEQQRVNIIRAVSLKPQLLLCDEPTGNLDSKNSSLVIALLRELSQDIQSTLILVTHDRKVSQEFSHTYLLEDGEFSVS
jgi:lipoprotein-releasing system ATP-binding protein